MMNNDTIKKALKYFIQWAVMFLAAKYIPSKELTFKEVTMVAIIGAVTFAILDMYSPSISDACRGTTEMTLGMKVLS